MEELKDQTNEEIQKQINELDFQQLSQEPKKASSDKSPVIPKAKELPPSKFDNNLDRWLFICKDLPSPELFLKLNFFFMISACLNRKIWHGIEEGNFSIFPNLYIILVSPPGIGKSLPTNVVNRLLDGLVETKVKEDGSLAIKKLLNLGPDAITWEKLIIRAASASETIKLDDKRYYHHASTTFCIGEELDMLLSENTKKVISFLVGSYNCGKFEGDWQKHGDILIDNICINFFGCTNPATMSDLMRSKVLTTGFIGRVLFAYCDRKRPHPPTIIETDEQKIEQEYIKRHLRKLCKLKPQNIRLTPEAKEWLDDWHYNKSGKKLNGHEKLLDYYARKKENLIKLAINHAYKDNFENVVVQLYDFLEAEKLLLLTEVEMHKALASPGDNPMAALADKIITYLLANGPCQKRKLYMDFYSLADVDQLDKVCLYLTNTGLCKNEQLNGKDGIRAL